eukprot:TRINITY_DN33862_c0_g1_i1.p1 TRINITY_DN33862_c0_g1~~TRINITY_DN33862_c0_g1_i1.p1  ORF type:complete len:184 (+),score=30.84 TRINITY_DN33862_c0_g1_i1:64-615(+)
MIQDIHKGLLEVKEGIVGEQYVKKDLVCEVQDGDQALQLLTEMERYNKEYSSRGSRVCFTLDYDGEFDPDDLGKFALTQPFRVLLKRATLLEMREISHVNTNTFLKSSKGGFRTIEGMYSKIRTYLNTSSLLFGLVDKENVLKLFAALLIVGSDFSNETDFVEFVSTDQGIILNYAGGNPNFA